MQIFCDGASRGNPGEASFGVVAFSESIPTLTQFKDNESLAHFVLFEKLGVKTNNEAEYAALIAALKKCAELSIRNPLICSDSELVIKQMKGEYKVKDAKMRDLFVIAQNISREVMPRYESVRREKNQIADYLANRALDG